MATNCIGPESINPRDQGQLVFPFENTIRRIRSWPAPTRRVINHDMRVLLAIFLCLPIHAAQRHFIWAIEHSNSRVYIAGAINIGINFDRGVDYQLYAQSVNLASGFAAPLRGPPFQELAAEAPNWQTPPATIPAKPTQDSRPFS